VTQNTSLSKNQFFDFRISLSWSEMLCWMTGEALVNLNLINLTGSDESRIIFLPERPSICQYTVSKFQPQPNCKKAIKSTSTFGPHFTVHFKNTKNLLYILKTTI